MGATNFLTGIIHAFVASLYVYTWYWTGFNIWKRFYHRDGRRFYHFITWWTFLNQTFYFIVVFCCDLIKVFVQPRCTQSYLYLDYYFSGLILPSALHSLLMFWLTTFFHYHSIPCLEFLYRWFPATKELKKTEDKTIFEKNQQDLECNSCLNLEHDESRCCTDNQVTVEGEGFVNATEQSNSKYGSKLTTEMSLSPYDSRSRQISFDNRSEHFEYVAPVSMLSLQVEPSSHNPDVVLQNSDFSLIFPSKYTGIPNWVLHVTHTAVGLSALLETLLSQPTATLQIQHSFILSVLIPIAHSFYICLVSPFFNQSHSTAAANDESTLPPPPLSSPQQYNQSTPSNSSCNYSPHSKTLLPIHPKSSHHNRQTKGTTISFSIAILLLAVFINSSVCLLGSIFSIYLNKWSNFLHTYIDMGFESAVVMQ